MASGGLDILINSTSNSKADMDETAVFFLGEQQKFFQCFEGSQHFSFSKMAKSIRDSSS